jgi:Cu-Zn family superoxide dismutase
LNGTVLVQVNLTGFSPNTEHGFHIHTYGDLTGGCMSTDEHYNPLNETHGGYDTPIRHAGDFGNFLTDANGYAYLEEMVMTMDIQGPYSIVGRACVVHAGQDDLGQGNTPLSLINGNSGPMIACGVVGLRNPSVGLPIY